MASTGFNARSKRRRSAAAPGLPAAVTAAVNRRAFALAQQAYPHIQRDLQALAWDLIEQQLPAAQVVESIERHQAAARGC